jgi:hypothetical protein
MFRPWLTIEEKIVKVLLYDGMERLEEQFKLQRRVVLGEAKMIKVQATILRTSLALELVFIAIIS